LSLKYEDNDGDLVSISNTEVLWLFYCLLLLIFQDLIQSLKSHKYSVLKVLLSFEPKLSCQKPQPQLSSPVLNIKDAKTPQDFHSPKNIMNSYLNIVTSINTSKIVRENIRYTIESFLLSLLSNSS
jgi:hypothetical protein